MEANSVCIDSVICSPGKLYRSFRAWKSFKRKSVHDKTLINRAFDHYEKALLKKAMFSWKGYIHLCFRIKVSLG